MSEELIVEPRGGVHVIRADNDVVVAIIDSGVENHEDIKVVGRKNIVVPAIRKANDDFQDSTLSALYLFDEQDQTATFNRVYPAASRAGDIALGQGFGAMPAGLRSKGRSFAESSNVGQLVNQCKASGAVTASPNNHARCASE